MRNRSHYNYWLKATCLLLVSCIIYFSSISQTTNISGIVNSYYQVIEVVPAKAAVRVSNTTGLVRNAHTMLIQMKGATINVTNSSSFGDTISLNNAGNYEIGVICAIIDDTVFMVNDLLNSYTVSDKVQLVQFAEYVSANVVDTIKAASWNNTTGTGGIIALFVQDTLTLNAPVYANAKGYNGGAFVQSNGTCSNGITNYFYNGTSSSPQNGAMKGEGIAVVATAQSGGRGAPANGGGGGNNHNNSGGGGANLNAGGRGGGNSSTSSCNASANHKGEGGRALSSWNGKKIFLGGGGGAGHNNNGVFTIGGANGGGIIFIYADTLIGNGYTISTDGGKGGNSQADGAGGGGGGGTIIMDVNTYEGSVNINAKGGDGGESNDGLNIGLCYGGGGGGSGGVVYFTGATPAITFSADAGAAGLETSRHDASCAAVQAASAGTNGQVISNYTYRKSSSLAGYCAILLPVGLTFFRATVIEKKVLLNWRITNPETAEKFIVERMNNYGQWIGIITVAANDLQEEYNVTDMNPFAGYNLYRIKAIEKNNASTYSPVSKVFIEQDKNIFTVYPNPAKDKIVIAGDFGSATEMKLSDVSGKILFTKKIISNQSAISFPSLAGGIYFIQINQAVKKLVIQ